MMEISCKAGKGKSICAFPDPCFTPPQTPATPPGVPIPYPNTGMSSDTSDGSSTVMISNEQVMIKDSSYFKSSTGDEAGCAPQKGVMTNKNKGKVYFIAWSMDVKAEGENVVRHLDLTTGNHGSSNANSLMTAHIDAMTPEQVADCNARKKDAETKCDGKAPNKCDKACKDAQKCQLVAYEDAKEKCCKGGNTGDHIVEASSFYNKGRGGKRSTALKGCEGYQTNKAPTCCVKGGAYSAEHGRMSTLRGYLANLCGGGKMALSKGTKKIEVPHKSSYGSAKKRAARVLHLVFPQCKEECVLAQFKEFDQKCDPPLNDDTEVRCTTYGETSKWVTKLGGGIKGALNALKQASGATGSNIGGMG
jgi:hypothetical protein